MDNVAIALSVAIAIVLVLLVTCWKKKSKKTVMIAGSGSSSSTEGMAAANEPDTYHTDTGTGPINTAARQRYKDISSGINAYQDYNQVAQYMSLEPEVFDSNNRYQQDMSQYYQGPSNLTERSDPNDINPWILRRPNYQAVYSDATVRVDSSESPDQMSINNKYVLNA